MQISRDARLWAHMKRDLTFEFVSHAFEGESSLKIVSANGREQSILMDF